MSKQAIFILGICTWVFLLSGVLRWLGIPSLDQLLYMMFGEPNGLNGLYAILLAIPIVYIILRLLRLNENHSDN
ncbi:hypothetical protein [Ureibacillus sinduriensis]|uniref:Uncharacterized protein n=1 Tax=Ureibacillus sinduriensis BLB-1 = JCM 15800 TaxID=1384057 RepID=A0A0A3I0F2_9BACL|nr:hypothetical protein [Ureibacillus sinduriensis]KGR76990.1 hypothetical protein CD33_04760 [Ureibacillus sinduriensis BLB-1 = JCM 15800]